MPESDVPHTVSAHVAPKHVELAYLPSAFARDAGDPLRAIAFWNGQHQYEPPVAAEASANTVADSNTVAEASANANQLLDAMRAERIGALAELVPQLIGLDRDRRPSVRITFATCFSILARAGQAPADREVWRALLGLAKYDDDTDVRAAAERALDDLERCSLVAQAS